jgi:excisionase family DNA binding protein
MTTVLESALTQLLKEIVHAVAAALVNELRAASPQQPPQPASQDSNLLLTARETAKRLVAISERHLYGLTRSGQLPYVRVGKCVRYSVETIRKWVRENETAERSSVTDVIKSKRTPPPKPAPAASRQKPEVVKRQRRLATRAIVTPKRELANDPQSKPSHRPQQVESEEQISPLLALLSELDIDRNDLPRITNGDLRRIAEVDTATMHSWLYLNRSLAEETISKLKEHFCRLVKDGKDAE